MEHVLHLQPYRRNWVNIKQRLILSISLAATLIIVGFYGIVFSLRYREEFRRYENKKLAYMEMAANLMADPLWELNNAGLIVIATAILEDQDIVSIVVLNEHNEIIYIAGKEPDASTESVEHDITKKSIKLGVVRLFFTKAHIRRVLRLQIYQLGIMLLLLILGLNVIVILAATSFTKPIFQLVNMVKGISSGSFTQIEEIQTSGELAILAKALYTMSREIQEREDRIKLVSAQAAETAYKYELEQYKYKTEQNLRMESEQLSRQLQESMEELKTTQNQLVNSEKLATLGGLVAGIAHEINTPIGIGVTAISYMGEQVVAMKQKLQDNEISFEIVEEWVATMHDSVQLTNSNLLRAAEIIRSFKQVSVDQASEAMREFYVCEYLHEIIASLHPRLKKTNHTVDVRCNCELKIASYPGALAQIFTNLIINSLIHGFSELSDGQILINVNLMTEGTLQIDYSDNGKGMSEEELHHIFEPFHTSLRNAGGSGLGTYIVYTIVTRKLDGSISVASTPGKGLSYHIKFSPLVISPGKPA
jgi:signal transduction histidine kinase